MAGTKDQEKYKEEEDVLVEDGPSWGGYDPSPEEEAAAEIRRDIMKEIERAEARARKQEEEEMVEATGGSQAP